MSNLIRFLFIFLISVLVSTFISVRPGEYFTSTIFNVAGIMFSLGLGLVVTFNLNGVKNKSYLHTIRKNLDRVRGRFIVYFAIIVLCYILDNILWGQEIVLFAIQSTDYRLNLSVFFCTIIFYSIFYFVLNFLNIQKLNNDIVDKLNEQAPL